jgi:5'-3' exonuclease, N-terminal resolvase-like domain/T4 RNase H, C terminal
MTILIDFNAVLIATVASATKELGSSVDLAAIKGYFFNDILSIKKKFSEYGQVVICCDSKETWRKDNFKYYKATRSEMKASAPFDWKLVHDALNEIISDIREFFPYKVVKVDKAEADDIIAVIAKSLNGYSDGLCSKTEQILIISSDGDFKQLQIIPTVKQYSTAMGKFIVENHPEEFLYKKILTGDNGDAVPNILSSDDAIVMKIRQKPITEARVNKWKTHHLETGELHPDLDVTKYNRNKMLVDLLHEIPDNLEKEIVKTYEEAKPASKIKTSSYFIKNKMKLLYDDLSLF